MDEHVDFYWALYNEEREAKTDLQKQFIDNCSNGTPNTRHEYAFYKFLVGSGNVEEAFEEPSNQDSDAIDPEEPHSPKTKPITRGAASVNDVLGGNNGRPLRTPEETIILGVFGSRKAWNRMRGRRNRHGK